MPRDRRKLLVIKLAILGYSVATLPNESMGTHGVKSQTMIVHLERTRTS